MKYTEIDQNRIIILQKTCNHGALHQTSDGRIDDLSQNENRAACHADRFAKMARLNLENRHCFFSSEKAQKFFRLRRAKSAQKISPAAG